MKLVSKLLLLICVFVLPLAAAQTRQPVPEPPQVAAKGYLLLDFNSGQILAEMNADERLEPASLTKIMTGYAVFREIAAGKVALTDNAYVSERAWRTGGSNPAASRARTSPSVSCRASAMAATMTIKETAIAAIGSAFPWP